MHSDHLARAEDYLKRVQDGAEADPETLNRIEAELPAFRDDFLILALPAGQEYDRAKLLGRSILAIAVFEKVTGRPIEEPVTPNQDVLVKAIGDLPRAVGYITSHKASGDRTESDRVMASLRKNLPLIRDKIMAMEPVVRLRFNRDHLLDIAEGMIAVLNEHAEGGPGTVRGKGTTTVGRDTFLSSGVTSDAQEGPH